jgi:HEAT repeat protein
MLIVVGVVWRIVVGPFLATSDIPGTAEFHALVDVLATGRAVESERIGPGASPSQIHEAFRKVLAAGSREQIVLLARHRSPVVRGYMAGYIAERLPEETEALGSLLRDTAKVEVISGCSKEASRVADLAVDALCAHAQAPAAQDTLLAAAKGKGDSKVRRRALECVAALRPAEARPIALRLVTSSDVALAAGAARTLGTVGAQEACPTLAERGADANDDVRAAGAEALGTLSCPEALSVLGRLLGDPDLLVKRASVIGYVKQPGHDRGAVQKLLHEPRADWVARALARAATPEALTLIDEYLMANPSDHMPVEELLQAPKTPEVTSFMRRRLRTSGNSVVRMQAMAYLKEVKDAECAPQYRTSINGPDVGERTAAAEAAAAIGDLEAVPALEKLLGDTNPHGRLAAARALVALGAKRSAAAVARAAQSDTSWAKDEMTQLATRLGT